MTFQAIVARQDNDRVTAAVETVEDGFLTSGDVTVSVEWSTVNYKDAIALAGQRFIQTFPLIPGIDFAGTVENSTDPRFQEGDKVVATVSVVGLGDVFQVASQMLAGRVKGRTLVDVSR